MLLQQGLGSHKNVSTYDKNDKDVKNHEIYGVILTFREF